MWYWSQSHWSSICGHNDRLYIIPLKTERWWLKFSLLMFLRKIKAINCVPNWFFKIYIIKTIKYLWFFTFIYLQKHMILIKSKYRLKFNSNLHRKNPIWTLFYQNICFIQIDVFISVLSLWFDQKSFFTIYIFK